MDGLQKFLMAGALALGLAGTGCTALPEVKAYAQSGERIRAAGMASYATPAVEETVTCEPTLAAPESVSYTHLTLPTIYSV